MSAPDEVRRADRKTLKREYAESVRPVGVFRVSHKESGRWLIGACLDIPAMSDRQRFQLDMGSHPNPRLQCDWRTYGADAFASRPSTN